MKRAGKLIALLLILLLCTQFFAACGLFGGEDKDTDETPYDDLPRLSAPSGAAVTGTDFTWQPVANAVSYFVQVRKSGSTSYLKSEDAGTSTAYSLAWITSSGDYLVKVMAKSDETNYRPSEYCDEVTYTVLPRLAAPQNLIIDGTELTWNEVPGAAGYTVTIDGIDYQSSVNSFSLAEFTEDKTYVITVIAIGDGIVNLNSQSSSSVDYVYEPPLPATEGLLFTPIGSAYIVSRGTATDTAVVIPAKFEGKPVTHIGSFADYAVMTSVSIPDSVTNIAAGAFAGCVALTEMTLPFAGESPGSSFYGSGTSIFGFIFGAEAHTNQNSFIPASLKTVTITNAKSIEAYTFYKCDNLINVTVKGNVTDIGAYAFGSCTSLVNVSLPAGISYIGDRAFSYCTSLGRFTIPKGVTEIRANAFLSSNGIYIIHDGVTRINANAFDGGGVAWFKGTPPALANSSSLFGKTIIVPDSRLEEYLSAANYSRTIYTESEVVDDCFIVRDNILYKYFGTGETAAIPEGIIEIANRAFYDYTALAVITVPVSVVNIGAYAFYNTAWYTAKADGAIYVNKVLYKYKGTMPASTSLSIAAGTLAIADGALENCSGLIALHIPDSLISFGAGAGTLTGTGTGVLTGCNNLTAITVGAGNTQFTAQNGVLYDLPVTQLIHAPASLSGDIVIPEGITAIGKTFAGKTGITSIIIPNSIGSMTGGALTGCTSLKSISLPFAGSLPNAVASEGHFGYIFGAVNYTAQNSSIPSALKSVTVTGNTRIADNAFYGLTGLTEITVKDTVPSIGRGAFQNCSALQKITVPFIGNSENATTYSGVFGFIFGYETSSFSSGTYTLQYNSGGTYYYYYIPSSLKTVTVTNGIIKANAFRNCANLTGIYFGSGVTQIQESVFAGTAQIQSIIIPATVTSVAANALQNSNLPTVYAEAGALPAGWSADFNYISPSNYSPVVWGCVLSTDKTYVVSFVKTAAKLTSAGESTFFKSPFREGYTFGGWSVTNGGIVVTYTGGTVINAPENTELFAVWL